jgi:hypothetical protein
MVHILSYIALFQMIALVPVLYAGKIDEKRWSIDFDGVTVSEALELLSKKTAVKIHTTKILDSRVRKSYQNKTIDQIIKDLLRNNSYSLVWSYSRQDIADINIRIFEKGKGAHPGNRPAQPSGRTVNQEMPARRPIMKMQPPPEEEPLHKEPVRSNPEDGGSEPPEPPDETPQGQAEPAKPDEAPGTQPVQSN